MTMGSGVRLNRMPGYGSYAGSVKPNLIKAGVTENDTSSKLFEIADKLDKGGVVEHPSEIRTASEAVRLPILDPAFQMGLAMGVLSAMMGRREHLFPKVAIDVVCLQDGNLIRAKYSLDLGNPVNPLSGEGTIGEVKMKESAHLEKGKILWKGEIGDKVTQELTLSVNEKDQTIHLQGTMGAVEADLDISPIKKNGIPFAGVRTEGTLMGDRYLADAMLDVPGIVESGPKLGTPIDTGALHVRGHVNGSVIEKDYTIKVKSSLTGFTLQASGGGTNAGSPQAVGVKVRVLPLEKR